MSRNFAGSTFSIVTSHHAGTKAVGEEKCYEGLRSCHYRVHTSKKSDIDISLSNEEIKGFDSKVNVSLGYYLYIIYNCVTLPPFTQAMHAAQRSK
jgi:hypothetical protein